MLPYLVLPVDHITGGDFRELAFFEIRQNLCADDMLLAEPCVELQLGLDVLFVERHKALEAHIDISLLLHQKLAFPRLSLFLGCKTALQFLLALTAPVGIAKLHIP